MAWFRLHFDGLCVVFGCLRLRILSTFGRRLPHSLNVASLLALDLLTHRLDGCFAHLCMRTASGPSAARASATAPSNAPINTRRFLMTTQHLSEDEAISQIPVTINLGVTQVVDGNRNLHTIVRKALFS